MLKKVVLIVPDAHSPFKLYRYFFDGLSKSLKRQSIECALVEGRGDNRIELYQQLLLHPPDCTICFNGLMPDNDLNFLADQIQIPHIAYLLDPPTRFFSLALSKYTIVACMDRYFCEFYKSLHSSQEGKERVLFMPHAIHHDLNVEPQESREFDIVAMATCYDFEGERQRWKTKYSKDICCLMDQVISITFEEPYTSFIEAFLRVLSQTSSIDPTVINFSEICYDVETYIKGYDRFHLIQTIAKERTVHIFGGPQKNVGWQKYFSKGDARIVLNPFLSLEQVVDVMKKAKIVLNPCPTVKDGSHERIFLALACGAAVCTSENLYIREQFQDDKGVLFYQLSKREEINSKIDALLKDELARCDAVKRGYLVVKQNHTWDSRVKQLKEALPKMNVFNETFEV